MDEQEQQDPSDDGYLEAQKSIIRQSFDEIVTDIGIEMRRAHLRFPLGITIPSSGSAFVTMVTPADDGDVSEARLGTGVRDRSAGRKQETGWSPSP
jgi:hypothetical protein